MSRPNGMIFLTTRNAVVEAALNKFAEVVSAGTLKKNGSITSRLTDYDGVVMHLVSEIDSPRISLHMKFQNAEELLAAGAREVLEQDYAPYTIAATEEHFSICISADFSNLPEDKDVVITKFATAKAALQAAPITLALKALRDGTPQQPRIVPYRPQETMYIVPSHDRVVCVFAVAFQDVTDRSLARVVMQEFADVRRVVDKSPPVSFSHEPPRELSTLAVREDPAARQHVGFMSFAIMPEHIQGGKLQNVAYLLQGFRAYLLYHIKAAKSQLHARMRRRVGLMQQVLNRAVPEKGDSTTRRTFTGRTLKR